MRQMFNTILVFEIYFYETSISNNGPGKTNNIYSNRLLGDFS